MVIFSACTKTWCIVNAVLFCANRCSDSKVNKNQTKQKQKNVARLRLNAINGFGTAAAAASAADLLFGSAVWNLVLTVSLHLDAVSNAYQYLL